MFAQRRMYPMCVQLSILNVALFELLRSRSQIIRHGRITTTMVRAKAVRKHVDHMITLSKNGSLHARRQVSGHLAFVRETNG